MLQCGTDEQLKIELLSQWKLEAEFLRMYNKILTVRLSPGKTIRKKDINISPTLIHNTR